ncbi:hypothetical protein GCM10022224_099390 [Nonomuraea antimicrobica]|uniref:Uncharacterized protein n=1 Tax=Nonomuraea antimicrobica TaxID=561173 RepID=A0ABP7EE33_9ACTN
MPPLFTRWIALSRLVNTLKGVATRSATGPVGGAGRPGLSTGARVAGLWGSALGDAAFEYL